MADAAPRLHIRDTGRGPALLLLHAFPQDGTMWDHQVAALSDRARCLRPDAPGCGASPAAATGGHSFELWVRALTAGLDAAGVERAVVAGSSMGGYLALALLRAAAERIAGLCLVGSHARADAEPARSDRLRMVERVRAGDGAAVVEELAEAMPARLLGAAALREAHIVDPIRGRIRRCTPGGIAACQEAMAGRPDSTGLLAAVQVPTLVVAGDADAVVPVGEAEAMASAVPEARLAVLPGAGHLVSLERHEEVSTLLGELLASAA